MRPSSPVLACAALLGVGFGIVFGPYAAWQAEAAQPRVDARRALAEQHGLTDLALFTEARYTRHPSQADLHSAFQDHPAALEHFPTGSLISPHPPTTRDHHATLAGKATAPD